MKIYIRNPETNAKAEAIIEANPVRSLHERLRALGVKCFLTPDPHDDPGAVILTLSRSPEVYIKADWTGIRFSGEARFMVSTPEGETTANADEIVAGFAS